MLRFAQDQSQWLLEDELHNINCTIRKSISSKGLSIYKSLSSITIFNKQLTVISS